MHKVGIVQTDMTSKNISSLETLNKACSTQLLNAQKEKEKMQKLYEDKITSLNNIINENIKSAKKEKNQKSNKNKNKQINNRYNEDNKINSDIDDNNLDLENNKNEEIPENFDPTLIFVPEMIPPENTYKIFIHCVKHFKYEENIYKKYLEEEDLYTLKSFVEKMEKDLIGSSLPTPKKNKKNKKEKSNNYIKPDNFLRKKYKENLMTNTKNKSSNSKENSFSNSDDEIEENDSKMKTVYSNHNTFNKYKAAIMALKDS